MRNLWEETIDVLNQHGKSWDNVMFVKAGDYIIENFEEIAKKTEYDNGFGVQEVAIDLQVVGPLWWLERNEYDGSEAWVYKEMPTNPGKSKKVKRLARGTWSTCEELN